MIRLFYIIILLLPLKLSAQWGEVFVKVDGFNVPSLNLSDSSQELNSKKSIYMDYFIGFNYYLSSNIYIGIASGYNQYRDESHSLKNYSNSWLTATDNSGTTHYNAYKLNIQIGKILKHNKFNLYGELGMRGQWFRNYGVEVISNNYDTTGQVRYHSEEVREYPNNSRYSFQSSVGVYYNLIGNLYLGADLMAILSYFQSDGDYVSHLTSNLPGPDIVSSTISTYGNTYGIDFFFRPTVGIRYLFGNKY